MIKRTCSPRRPSIIQKEKLKMITDAFVVEKPGSRFTLQKIHVEDDPREDEVMVEMCATGLCHTDLNFSKEHSMPELFPAVFGHEGAGAVIKIGAAVKSLNVGDNVILSYSSCGSCKYCRNQETSYCNHFEKQNFGIGRDDGSKAYSSSSGAITSHFFGQSSFARHAIVMASCAVKIDRDLPLKTLAPLGCGVMTGAGALLNVLQPESASSVICVSGVGAVGLAALMATRLVQPPPAKVIAVDVVPERLELAKKFGATVTIDCRQVTDLKAALLEATGGEGIDGSIDATGRPEVAETLLRASAKKGSVVQVGVGQLTAEVSACMFDTVNSGRTYRGCAMGSCFPPAFIPKLIEAWKEGIFPFTELVKEYPVMEMDRAVEDVSSGRVVKAVLIW
ncbi:aryl-alcohol dehydrogenase [Fusarium oxysporum f. sp. albedinis]|nr:aryl-alcohol dehydrogenase [Fusarium oxysporum f. sp. albedinis]